MTRLMKTFFSTLIVLTISNSLYASEAISGCSDKPISRLSNTIKGYACKDMPIWFNYEDFAVELKEAARLDATRYCGSIRKIPVEAVPNGKFVVSETIIDNWKTIYLQAEYSCIFSQ